MKILLIRPDPGNERFGLGPFFRMEPLGLEYVAQALIAAGHEPLIVDLRFGRGLKYWMRKHRPALVGISCMHALEYDQVVELATQVRRLSPSVFLLVGGHAAAVYPKPLEIEAIDALCLDDGEEVAPALAQALAAGRSPASVPALRIRTPDGFVNTEPLGERTCLDLVPLPARGLVERYRRRYHCLIFKPAWVIETSRGCPYRCSFCSVWQLNERTFRERSVAAVVDDFAACGPHVFVADDLFWYHPARSREIARALKQRGVRKRWLLVQSRCDLVASQAELLEEWRDVAQDFDIFFGMESASDDGLDGVAKDAPVEATVKAIELARSLRYGVVGNFLIDPDWGQEQFEELWSFVASHDITRTGFTLLTPLPGTELFASLEHKLAGQPWFKYDMHHLLWEPRLGAKRFFELYAETWKRSVLNLSGPKSLTAWARQVRPAHLPVVARLLFQTQRLMKPSAYLREHAMKTAPR